MQEEAFNEAVAKMRTTMEVDGRWGKAANEEIGVLKEGDNGSRIFQRGTSRQD